MEISDILRRGNVSPPFSALDGCKGVQGLTRTDVCNLLLKVSFERLCPLKKV